MKQGSQAKFYNFSTVRIPADGADALAVVLLAGSPPPAPGATDVHVIETVVSGNFEFSTDNWAPGVYQFQRKTAGAVTGTGRFTLEQDLFHAPDGFDPRSVAEITLEAIDAMLAGRATAQQRKVQVGDKSIEYSTMDELLKWREYFRRKLMDEQGKTAPKRILSVFRRS